MKKRLFVLFLIMCLVLVGCKKKGKNVEDNTVGDITINEQVNGVVISRGPLEYFYLAANKYMGESLKPLALLATQVSSSTDYMYLCKSIDEEDNVDFKIVVVSNDRDGNNTIISVKDFNVLDYFNKSISGSNENLDGGWNIIEGFEGYDMSDSIHSSFKKANVSINSNGLLLVSKIEYGNNYGILTVGKDKSIRFVTIKVTSDKNVTVVSDAYVNLSEYGV